MAACGSSDDDDSAIVASLDDVTGVWDANGKYGAEEDEVNIIIKSDGTLTIFDFDGDTYDQGDDCYDKVINTFTDLGNGNFQMVNDNDSPDNMKITKSGNKLTVVFADGSDTRILILSSLVETDFVPLCE